MEPASEICRSAWFRHECFRAAGAVQTRRRDNSGDNQAAGVAKIAKRLAAGRADDLVEPIQLLLPFPPSTLSAVTGSSGSVDFSVLRYCWAQVSQRCSSCATPLTISCDVQSRRLGTVTTLHDEGVSLRSVCDAGGWTNEKEVSSVNCHDGSGKLFDASPSTSNVASHSRKCMVGNAMRCASFALLPPQVGCHPAFRKLPRGETHTNTLAVGDGVSMNFRRVSRLVQGTLGVTRPAW